MVSPTHKCMSDYDNNTLPISVEIVGCIIMIEIVYDIRILEPRGWSEGGLLVEGVGVFRRRRLWHWEVWGGRRHHRQRRGQSTHCLSTETEEHSGDSSVTNRNEGPLRHYGSLYIRSFIPFLSAAHDGPRVYNIKNIHRQIASWGRAELKFSSFLPLKAT